MKDSDMLKLDFNALKLLKVLGEEKNTKRAGERLFISQPAVSKSLKKLREQFNDPLFTRKKHGLEATPKCEELLHQLPDILSRLEALFEQGHTFDPGQYTGEISVHINTVLFPPIMHALFKAVTQAAPKATINIQNWAHDTEQKIRTSQADLGINFMPLPLSKEIIQQHVVSTQFKLCCRAGHPLSQQANFSVHDLGNWPLALMVMPDYHQGEAFAETYLKVRGITPKVLIRTDKIELCYEAVRHHDCVFPVSHIVSHVLPDEFRLLGIEHFDSAPDFSIGCFYSQRSRHSPYISWLSALVTGVLRELS